MLKSLRLSIYISQPNDLNLLGFYPFSHSLFDLFIHRYCIYGSVVFVISLFIGDCVVWLKLTREPYFGLILREFSSRLLRRVSGLTL